MNLVPTEYQGQRILTTAQLAKSYGTNIEAIKRNYERNSERYIVGKHYYLLEGEALREFKASQQFVANLPDEIKYAPKLYLWTEKGAWRHAKSLNSDEAWNAYETLVDDYYEKIETLNKVVDELQSLRETMKVANESASLLSGLIESAGLKPEIKLLTTKVIYRHLGIELPIEIAVESKLFDTKEIAKRLGMFTESGNPAFHAVGAIIRKLDIDDSEKQVVLESTGSWQGTVIKYNESVIGKVGQWLKENNYPTVIATTTGTGTPKNYKIKFLA